MVYNLELKNVVTLVFESRKHNSGTYGDKISQELGMYDDFVFFSDIFLKSYVLRRGLHKSGKLYSAITGNTDEKDFHKYFDGDVIRLNNDELLIYIPNDKIWGVLTETDESCERLLNSLKIYKNEFKKAEAYSLINFLCGKIRQWDKRELKKLYDAADRHLLK